MIRVVERYFTNALLQFLILDCCSVFLFVQGRYSGASEAGAVAMAGYVSGSVHAAIAHIVPVVATDATAARVHIRGSDQTVVV